MPSECPTLRLVELPRLAVKRPDGKEVQHSLAVSEVTIGRSPTNRICIPDLHVSKCHAKLVLDGNSIKMMDLGSTNKTRVNGVVITQATLSYGDTIHIAGTECRLLPPQLVAANGAGAASLKVPVPAVAPPPVKPLMKSAAGVHSEATVSLPPAKTPPPPVKTPGPLAKAPAAPAAPVTTPRSYASTPAPSARAPRPSVSTPRGRARTPTASAGAPKLRAGTPRGGARAVRAVPPRRQSPMFKLYLVCVVLVFISLVSALALRVLLAPPGTAESQPSDSPASVSEEAQRVDSGTSPELGLPSHGEANPGERRVQPVSEVASQTDTLLNGSVGQSDVAPGRSVDFYFDEALSLIDAGRLRAARANFVMILEIDANNRRAQSRLALLDEQIETEIESHFNNARQAYQFLRYDEAIAEWEIVMELAEPTDPRHAESENGIAQARAKRM